MNNRRLIHLVGRWDVPVRCPGSLPALDSLILWEQFRPVLEAALSKERSLWSFLEILRWQGLIYPLFDRFYDLLNAAGVRVEQSKIVDVRVVGLAGARG